jgi:hypothetical protein
MKRLLVAVVAMLMVPGWASAWNKVPDTGTVKVLYLVPRNAPITVPAGGQGFYFVTDTAVSITSAIPGCGNGSASTFFVPKADPGGSGTDNPAYRDTVNSLMIAYLVGRPMSIYIDSCVNGYPRVVGLDVL